MGKEIVSLTKGLCNATLFRVDRLRETVEAITFTPFKHGRLFPRVRLRQESLVTTSFDAFFDFLTRGSKKQLFRSLGEKLAGRTAALAQATRRNVATEFVSALTKKIQQEFARKPFEKCADTPQEIDSHKQAVDLLGRVSCARARSALRETSSQG